MRSLCACAALVLAGCAAGPKEGYTFLFDGETLDGWQRHEKMPGGEWAVVDGAIAGKEGGDASGGFLATARSYKNFIIELDVSMDWPFDSGVFLRVGPDGKSHQVTLDYRPGGEIGGIYVPWGPGFVCHALPAYVCGDTPDSIALMPLGACEWASGSQVCIGTSAAFTPNPMTNSAPAANKGSASTRPAAARISSRFTVPVNASTSAMPSSTSTDPTALCTRYFTPASSDAG